MKRTIFLTTAISIVAGLGMILLVYYLITGSLTIFSEKKATHIVQQDDRLPLHLFVAIPAVADTPAPENDYIRQTIEEQFDVKLKMTYARQGDNVNSQLASLLLANNPPDVWIGISDNDGAQFIADNVLADMGYYVTPETMPNYFTYWIRKKELKEYQWPNKFIRAPIPYDKKSYRSYYIRKDWLDRLQLDVPKTYEQYVDVLKAFSTMDPDQNGMNDTYGFTTSGNGSSISLDWPEYVKNGLLLPHYLDDNGNLVDMQTDPQIEQTVTDILSVIQRGFVDPDWFLNKGNQHVDKAVQGRAGVILGDTENFAFDSNPDSIQNKTKAINPEAEWMPFNPFDGQPLRSTVMPGDSFVYSNAANADKLKRITQILDWLASEEGFLLTHYGIENRHYTRQANFISLNPNANFITIWNFFTPASPEVFGLQIHDPHLTARDQLIRDYLISIPIQEGVGTTLTPPLGVNVQLMRDKQNELQVKMLFEDQSSKKWLEYRNIIMNDYKGLEIFKQYALKIVSSSRNQ